MKALLTSMPAKILTVMSAITVVLGFLSIDQLSNPPVFSAMAQTASSEAGQPLLEVELAARSSHTLRDTRIAFFLTDENGQRIRLVDTVEGQMDYFAPIDMLISANQSKFALIAQEDTLEAKLSDVDYIYICATFKGRILGMSHYQSYILENRNGSYFQLDADRGFAILSRPKCDNLSVEGAEMPALAIPSRFD